MRLLKRLPELVKPGGQLFITTPFTWLDEYTPPANWLGDGAQDSFAGLQAGFRPSVYATTAVGYAVFNS
jgi:hypothetical protein